MIGKSERDQLARLARQRARLAKSEVGEREKILQSEVEDLLAAEYTARDELWAEATAIAEEAARKANDQILAQCAMLGIPKQAAPQLELRWHSRGNYADAARRAEERKVANARLAALTAMAKTEIDRQLLHTETQLLRQGLESAEAVAFLDAMPTAEQLLPSIGLDDIGVSRWQPATGTAAALLTPSTPADRKRKAVLRALATHPDASDRKIAEIAGCDHKTVAKYRAGEFPALAGEIPAGDGDE